MKRIVLLVVLFLLSAIAVGGAAARPATGEGAGVAPAAAADLEEFFYNGQTKIPLRIPLDRIGVLARDGANPDVVAEFVKQYGLDRAEEFPGGVLIFALGQEVSRDELNDLARKLVADGQDLIAQAGLAALPSESRTPMLISNEIIIAPADGVSDAEIDDLNAKYGLVEVDRLEGQRRLALVAPPPDLPADGLTVSQLYYESGLVDFAHPNFVVVVDYRETTPNDTLYGSQWHHRNGGASGGTVDADADTSWAWDITTGVAANALIAVVDNGFDVTHPDLTPNLWANPTEAADGVDNDGNGKIDDRIGWDFTGCDSAMAPAGCGDSNLAGGDHGTAVAGVAAARGNNALGVSGACPRCGLMLVRQGSTSWANGVAINYAWQEGAHVVTNSWGYAIGTPTTANVQTAITNAATNGRGGLGSVVLFAMNNGNINDCIGATPDISSLPNVIAVSASSNQDRKVTESAWGNCMDVLAPTHRGYGGATPYSGTLNITTTDAQGNAGYNNTSPPSAPCPGETADRNYTNCFGGTSSATPLTAGVVGLMLSTNPGLTRLQAQRILQDTTDKIQDSVGAYSAATGFSAPASGVASHGYGRISAYEAVRVAAPGAMGGRGNVDIFVRDNRLDWGNTSGYDGQQNSGVLFEPARGFIPWYQSVDIKVDAPSDGLQPPPTTSAAFDAFVDQMPESGSTNMVYVRVRNRGQTAAAPVTVKLHYAYAGTGLPALPADFWTQFPADSANTTQVVPVGAATIPTLAYSGASVAGSAADAARIVAFTFNAPSVDPSRPNPTHYCLFVVTDSPQDPVDANGGTDFIIDSVVPNDNNVTLRNVNLIDTGRSRRFELLFYVRNPYREAIRVILRPDAGEALQHGWKLELDQFGFDQPFELAGGEEVLVTLKVSAPDEGMTADIAINQFLLTGEEATPMGGLAWRFAPAPPVQLIYLPAVKR